MMQERSPGFKLVLAGLVGLVLMIPLIMVYGLVSDRQHQARVAQDSITAGSGGAQVVSGPVLVIPYEERRVSNETVNGVATTRTQTIRKQLFLSPEQHTLETTLEPERKRKALYETVIYLAQMDGTARFVLPDDLSRFGATREQLLLDEAQIRFGNSDPRGLRAVADVRVDGEPIELQPGEGVHSSGGAGFHGNIDWSSGEPLSVAYDYTLRGSLSLTLVPRGGQTDWKVSSPWAHPGFGGSFLPDRSEISSDGFTANWSIGNLALGQSMVMQEDLPPVRVSNFSGDVYTSSEPVEAASGKTATIRMVEPADIYAQVDRSVKYGFLFIGFTFLTYLLFDVVGGARVAPAEYLLTGAGLVLFFVMLLAFAEVMGFALAYVLASAAIIGLLTAYSAAVLGGWKRAGFIGVLLTALYAGLYILLSLEAASLIVGSLSMFLALAGVMYATRNVEWSRAGRSDELAES
ncbi:cell envelope integrity protein CreD [Qipengyuania sp. 1NDW9]|nr:cell envelope integrity protein CreD [Qipengyuania xiapuensis]